MDSVSIPAEDFRLAITECCKDPVLKWYYDFAPGAAKLYVGLTFYAMYFGNSIDKAQYYQCMKDIETDLDILDLQYLIRFETDKKYKDYLKELLAKKTDQTKESKLFPPSRNREATQVDYNFLAIQRRLVSKNDAENNSKEKLHSDFYSCKNNWHGVWKWLLGLVGVAVCGIVLYMFQYGIEESRNVKCEKEEVVPLNYKTNNFPKIVPVVETTKIEIVEKEEKENKAILEERNKEMAEKLAEMERTRAQKEKERESFLRKQELYYTLDNAFLGVNLSLWSMLPKDCRPGSKNLQVLIMTINDMNETEYHRITTIENGDLSIEKISREKGNEPVNLKDLNSTLSKKGCLYLCNGTAYYMSPKERNDKFPFPSSGYFEPSKMVLGEYQRFIRSKIFRTDSLLFNVSFVPTDNSADVRIGDFKFGQSVSRYEVERILIEKAQVFMKQTMASKKIKKTVVFYDGSIIKRGLDGVVYVPKIVPDRCTADYYKMRDEAERQARRERYADREADIALNEQVRKFVASELAYGGLRIQILMKQ